ncbi:MAG: hypothetical protein SGPRY_002924 [Prymnesium sp.]
MATYGEYPGAPSGLEGSQPGYTYAEYPAEAYANQPPQYYAPPAPETAAAPAQAEEAPPLSDAEALAAARAEIASLKAEIAILKANAGTSSSSPALLPPPQFYYPSYPPYGTPAPWGYPMPNGGQQPARPAPPTLALNAENKRGPKGANLAVFCIPNSYYDQQVYELAKPYGNVVFCQVACHRDTGTSRGYAFVSYETVEEAERAISALHNFSVEGRALRVEVARADRESKPY